MTDISVLAGSNMVILLTTLIAIALGLLALVVKKDLRESRQEDLEYQQFLQQKRQFASKK